MRGENGAEKRAERGQRWGGGGGSELEKRGFSTEDTTFVVVNERKFRGNLWDYEYFSDEGR